MRQFALCISAVLALAARPVAASELVVHEWGTFTSVAGKDGVAIDWQTQGGPSDLPSFVYTPERAGLRHSREVYEEYGKGGRHLVRMETPVVYFYSDIARDVSLKVSFPQGRITEYYPQ